MWPTLLFGLRNPGSHRNRTQSRTRRRTPLRRAPGRLLVEHLEDRTVPSTFVVNTIADTVDFDLTDGLALDAAGNTSLRAAVMQANHDLGADVITFAPQVQGTITLDRALGQLNITDALTIDGPGADLLAVSGNDASRVFRISSDITVDIDDLTITHGKADGSVLVQSQWGFFRN
jgi:hypothetical protein